ncbi:MAG: choice-of-anchor D domain-containing protein, partial [Calditrichaeota bacterium]|nr:choice-of-anchor D domain-containing protein [Calditrichota bacterium]
MNSAATQNLHVIRVGDRQQLRTMNFRNVIGFDAWAIGWVPKHDAGHLWANSSGVVRQYNVSGNAPQLVQQFNWPAQYPYCGVGHDGYNLWCGRWDDQRWFVVDDGIAETYWFGYDPTEGELDAGGDQNVVVTLSAEGLVEGDYEGVLMIFSNDPASPQVDVNVLLHVTGAPVMEATWDEAAGFPDIMDWDQWDARFPDLFTGGPYSIPVTIENTGTANLVVEDIVSDDDNFYADPRSFELGAGEATVVNFILDAAEDGEHAGTMTFVSNAGNNDDIAIAMHGTTSAPPEIGVDPQAIETDMITGEVQEHVINVSNGGQAPLRWTTDSEIISEPEGARRRDAGRRNLRIADGFAGPVAQERWIDFGASKTDRQQIPASVLNNPPVGGMERLNLGPRRDEPNDLRILLVKGAQDQYGWFDRNSWLEVFQNQDPRPDMANMENLADVDLSQYDLVATGEDQSAAFFQAYTQRRDQIMEYVDGGGVYSMFCGSNTFQQINLFSDDGNVAVVNGPGGDWGTVNPMFLNQQGNGLAAGVEEDYPLLTPFEFFRDDNQDANRIRTRMRGNSLNYNHVLRNSLPEEAVWYYQPEGHADKAILADWPFGRGHVLYTGITGTLFYEANWRWSSMAECVNLTRWADAAGGTRWLAWDPSDGTIDAGGDENIVVTLNAEGLVDGDYEAVLMILSNDPANPQVDVNILVHVTGEAAVQTNPIAEPMAGAADVHDFGRVYVGAQAEMAVEIRNVGTRDLTFEGVDSDNPDEFGTDFDVDLVLAPGERDVFYILFTPQDINDRGGRITFVSSARNIDGGGTFWFDLVGQGITPPDLETDATVRVGMLLDDDPVVRNLQIANVAGDGGDDLIWSIVAQPDRDQGNRRDASGRGLRNAEGNLPGRDRRGNPDQAGYEWRASDEGDGPQFEWIDIVNMQGRVQLQGGDDINVGPYNLGFNFPYYGQNYGQVRFCSNGW